MAEIAHYEKRIIDLYVGENDNYRVTSSLESKGYGRYEEISIHDIVADKKTKEIESCLVYGDIHDKPVDIRRVIHIKHLSELQEKYGVIMLDAYMPRKGKLVNGKYVDQSYKQTEIEF